MVDLRKVGAVFSQIKFIFLVSVKYPNGLSFFWEDIKLFSRCPFLAYFKLVLFKLLCSFDITPFLALKSVFF